MRVRLEHADDAHAFALGRFQVRLDCERRVDDDRLARVGVVDALVSMTAPRTYRTAMPVTGALTDIWRLTGTTYDARPVGALFALVREGRVRIPETA